MASSHREPKAHFNGESRAGQLSRRTFLGRSLRAVMSSPVVLIGLAGRNHAVKVAARMSDIEGAQPLVLMRTTPPPPLDITTFFPELAPLTRQAVRLHPRPGGEPGPDESKVGGMFLWPGNEPWPLCPVGHAHSDPGISQDAEVLRWEAENAQVLRRTFEPDIPSAIQALPMGEPHGAYVGVLQMRAADVPELEFPEGFDLFQLLWCPRDHDHSEDTWRSPACRVYWRQSRHIPTALKENPVPTHFTPKYIPQACQLFPERIQEYPTPQVLPRELQERIWSWEETESAAGYSYMKHLSVAPGIKIGGHVAWLFYPDVPLCASCQQEMEHLLTINSEEWDIEQSRWRPVQDQHVNVDGYGKHAFSLYVFVCRHCPGWPTAYRSQSY